MTFRDELSLPCSGATRDGIDHYARALAQLQCYIEDPVASVDEAIARAPGFTMAHVLRAYLHLLGTEPADIAIANASLETASRLAADRREQAHVEAVGQLVQGHWHRAGRVLEDIAIAFPRDILALQVGHQVDFFTGNSRMLRDRIARALPAWDDGMPGYHAVLGMYAFGLEETGALDLAERHGREAVQRNERDGWGQHAVAHVMEIGGRPRDGIAWMRDNAPSWSADSFFQVHNWWHLALYHLELGEMDEVLSLFDGPIHGQGSTVVLDMVDAASLLWRLHLRGVDVGDRWQTVAEGWAPLATAGNYAFNDMHVAMAFAGAHRPEAIDQVIEAQQLAMTREDDNAAFTHDVGHPVVRAIQAFAEGNYRLAIDLLRQVREHAHRFGGSHAQRDVLNLTLVEAALRSGDAALATALATERSARRPHSPLCRLLERRAGSLGAAA